MEAESARKISGGSTGILGMIISLHLFVVPLDTSQSKRTGTLACHLKKKEKKN